MINHLLDIPPMPGEEILEGIDGITIGVADDSSQSFILVGAILASLILLGVSLLIVYRLRKARLS